MKRILAAAGAVVFCSGLALAVGNDEEEKSLRVTSEPPNARVIINGRDRGTTPFEMKLGRWAFDTKKHSVFSKHLNEPMILEIESPGFRTERLEITRGFEWHSLDHRNSYRFWVISSPNYSVRLRPITRTLTNADVIDLLKTGLDPNLVIDKIQTSACEFHTDPADLLSLRSGGVPDAVISAMMHALPIDQAGAVSNIQPAKK